MLTQLAVYCPYCKQNRAPHDFRFNDTASGIVICQPCWDHHYKLEAAFSDALARPPDECQICNRRWDDEETVYVHHIDGIYQMVCKACSDKYARQRADLYRATPYGKALKV